MNVNIFQRLLRLASRLPFWWVPDPLSLLRVTFVSAVWKHSAGQVWFHVIPLPAVHTNIAPAAPQLMINSRDRWWILLVIRLSGFSHVFSRCLQPRTMRRQRAASLLTEESCNGGIFQAQERSLGRVLFFFPMPSVLQQLLDTCCFQSWGRFSWVLVDKISPGFPLVEATLPLNLHNLRSLCMSYLQAFGRQN